VGLVKELGAGPVALDTAPFIYLIEERPQYLPIVRARLGRPREQPVRRFEVSRHRGPGQSRVKATYPSFRLRWAKAISRAVRRPRGE
jgi:hypothetical protein